MNMSINSAPAVFVLSLSLSLSRPFSFLKVKVPTDLPASALNRISEILDTQLGYVRQLGQYISSTLQVRIHSSETVQLLWEWGSPYNYS